MPGKRKMLTVDLVGGVVRGVLWGGCECVLTDCDLRMEFKLSNCLQIARHTLQLVLLSISL